jgi:negative regulator of sigma E activity
MKCTETKELLVAYFEGLLEDSEQKAVEEHLKDCSACQAELQELKGLQDRLVTNGKALAQSNLEEDVMNQVIREQNTRLKAAARASDALKIRRTIMKSSITRIAAAAMIIVAVLVGISQFTGGTVTFAQAIEPILKAQTIVFDLVIGNDETSPVMHEVVSDSLIRRTISNMPNMVMIIDMDNNNMLALDTAGKTASYVELGQLAQKTENYIESIRRIIIDLQDGLDIERLAEREIDGKNAIGFKGRNDTGSIIIWADPKTALPIKIELEREQWPAIFKNFEFDPQIEQISMEIPEGYTQDKAQLDLSDADEQDLIESLRIWAKFLLNGVFPDAIGTEAYMNQIGVLGHKIPTLDIPESEKEQVGFQFAKGMIFLQNFELGDQWHYAGKGVNLGDANTAIFWYQPQGSETYRVIYGDLSVKDVAEENLPN